MTASDGPHAAKAAGLRYTTDTVPGIRRLRRGKSFVYLRDDGTRVTDTADLARIGSLAIPPAYRDVWICPLADGHLQATGRDARGRKQYRYHKRWRAVRDENKFDRMLVFAKALPTIRKAVARDLALPGLPREKVLASVISLLEATAIRVGNEEYARENDSYGLTTLQEQHAEVKGSTIRFHFRGKSGKVHDVEVHDKRLARIVKASQGLPGEHLFEYVDEDGSPRPIHSDDVNEYLREISGGEFTAKDFRTWEATMSCALELAAMRVEGSGEAKKAVVEAIKRVAERLGNTPTVCKKSYIHPAVIDAFAKNGALALVERAIAREPQDLSRHEDAVIRLIEQAVEAESRPLAELLERSVKAERAKSRRKRAAA
jgi:DNA topoisomerase-1